MPIASIAAEVEQLRAEKLSLQSENNYLIKQIEALKKAIFGAGKSEKLDAAQLHLKLGEIKELEAKVTARTETVSYERRKPAAARESAAEHFADIPVTEQNEIIPDEAKADPSLYERIGEEQTFEIGMVPARLIKRLTVRPKFRHRLNKSLPPVIAPAPKRPVEGGWAGADLITWVVVSKYVDHLPLYRQEKMSARWGATISRKTMSDWVEIVAMWLKPIYNRMREELIAGGYVQADETLIKYLEPDLKKAKTKQGFLWVISRPGGDVVFDWHLSRRHAVVDGLLAGFEGLLQSDGYEAYESFARRNPKVERIGC